jgi:hypothetical protein
MLCGWLSLSLHSQHLFNVVEGEIAFVSNAPLEVIRAKSQALRGLIDAEKRTFAFTLSIETFEGFNSPLQRIHFNENYLESNVFPEATFAGKIIEDVDLTQSGTYDVRVKGKLLIHGTERERIMRGTLVVDGETLNISCAFEVVLEEHNIRIPRIVYQKIAEVIQVNVSAELHPLDR